MPRIAKPIDALTIDDILAICSEKWLEDELAASSLSKMANMCIEPPLTGLQMRSVPSDASGSGIVVLSVPKSHSAPHRLEACDRFRDFVGFSSVEYVLEAEIVTSHDLPTSDLAMNTEPLPAHSRQENICIRDMLSGQRTRGRRRMG
jgi:hypothetical protein